MQEEEQTHVEEGDVYYWTEYTRRNRSLTEEGGRLLKDSTVLPSSDFGSSLEYFHNTYEPVSVKTEMKGNKQLLPLTPLLISWGSQRATLFFDLI